ncbi:hypothetical protein DPMN_183996 [Dreissena polymorpha]|uniref:Uncharacterized protein n=1 Tax=Dreissena polymorpha TaxID=45954 RepID=A0A9D4I6W9_DREPO|nr:hypothetical protein DPMN_183996 [Dreissena polymorpha]
MGHTNHVICEDVGQLETPKTMAPIGNEVDGEKSLGRGHGGESITTEFAKTTAVSCVSIEQFEIVVRATETV